MLIFDDDCTFLKALESRIVDDPIELKLIKLDMDLFSEGESNICAGADVSLGLFASLAVFQVWPSASVFSEALEYFRELPVTAA